MASQVIAISRTLAAGGEEIGRLVASELGFRYVDDEIVNKAAELAGVSPTAVEQAEHSQPFLARLMESLASVSVEPAAWSPATLPPTVRSSAYEGLIERAIRETAAGGNVVIVAHGASIPLAGIDGLLRVLVTASAETRVQRLQAQATVGDRTAKRAVQDSDRERRDYLRRFYRVETEDPTLYDLVVNTDVLPPPLAARLIVTAARG